MKSKTIWIFFLIAIILTGCVKKEQFGNKKDVSYGICKKSVFPKELKDLLEKEKKEAFHFTFTIGEFTYYAVGYGKQMGHGYKVQVDCVQSDEDHIYIETTLIGVTKEKQKEGVSYPYVVIKTQTTEKEAVFR